MAADFTSKQKAFVAKFAGLVQSFLNDVDQLNLAVAEFANDAYGTGGQNAISDAIVQEVLPACTAAAFNTAEAEIVTCLNTVASVRSGLEIMRP